MIYNILTTQPTIYDSFLKTGLTARGLLKKIIKINVFSLYDFALDKHHSIDDTPYGGGPGMVLRVDIVDRALSAIKLKSKNKKIKTILLTPQGKRFDQKLAIKLAKEKELIIISGRFEGYDERIRNLVNVEISIGDYVLTSGDLPAMVLIDTISRQIPGFIEKKESIKDESFSKLEIGKLPSGIQIKNCLEYPQYTRPPIYKKKKVPDVLLSGNHAKIALWRKNEAYNRTLKRRKDLS